MDINNPVSFNHKTAFVNGINIHYVDQNPESQNVILCVHGWPDLWYGWRHQIVHLANKGYRVIAPDLRGFGETDAPASSSEYGYGTVSTDLVRLLDHLSIPQVILLGHDWGGLVVWRMTAFYPDRVKAVASFCTPYIPPTDKYIPLEELIKILPNFTYQEFLASPEGEQELNNNTELLFRLLFRQPGSPFYDPENRTILKGRENIPKSDCISQETLDFYTQQYSVRGFRGPLNWYRQSFNNFEQCKDLPKTIQHHALMVVAGKDVALPPAMAKDTPKFVPNVLMKNVDEAGHWILWQHPDKMNAYLDEWLEMLSAQTSGI